MLRRKGGTMLSKDEILAEKPSEMEKVDVPEWGGEVFVRVMSGAERDAFEAGMIASGNGKANYQNVRARLAVRCICDGEGHRVFMDGDALALGKGSCVPLDKVFAVAQRINHIGDADIEALAGNSDAAPSGDSGSD